MGFKLKTSTIFPADVVAQSPLTVTKVGRQYTFGVDSSQGALGPAGPGYGGTSTTSLAIGTGSKAFVTQAGLAYAAGNYIRASSAADGTNFMEGTITSLSLNVDGTVTLIMNATKTGGSGTKTDWVFSISGAPGANGAGSGDLLAANNLSDVGNKKIAKDNISIHGADVASATTTNLETATGDLVDVTGTTTITAITLNEGHERTVRFTGALTLTHGASLVLPGAANITTAAGDFAVFRGYAASVVRCVSYDRISGPTIGTITGLGTGVATFLATPSSANLRSALTDETGTGAAVFATSPTITTPNIVGVSDGSSASAGNVTEFFQQDLAAGSALTMTSGVTLNVTSKSVSAGRWLIWGNVVFSAQASTAYNETHVSVSLVSATPDTAPGTSHAEHVTYVTGQAAIKPTANKFLNVSGATTVYLTATCTVTGGSAMLVYGSLFGIRLP